MERINVLKRLLAEAEAEEILRRVAQRDTKMNNDECSKCFTSTPLADEMEWPDDPNPNVPHLCWSCQYDIIRTMINKDTVGTPMSETKLKDYEKIHKACRIFEKYVPEDNVSGGLHCEHDIIYFCYEVTQDEISAEDLEILKSECDVFYDEAEGAWIRWTSA